ETAVQAVVAHRQASADLLVFHEPGFCRPLVAERINQLEAEALVTGEYAAVVDRRKLGVGHVPAVLHQALEPGVGVQNDGLDRRARLGARGLETVRRSR